MPARGTCAAARKARAPGCLCGSSWQGCSPRIDECPHLGRRTHAHFAVTVDARKRSRNGQFEEGSARANLHFFHDGSKPYNCHVKMKSSLSAKTFLIRFWNNVPFW